MGVQDFHLEPSPKMFSVYQKGKILHWCIKEFSNQKTNSTNITPTHHHAYSKHKSQHHLSMHCQNFGRMQFRNLPYQKQHHQENGHNHVTHHFHHDLDVNRTETSELTK